jgi:hypothetical protein
MKYMKQTRERFNVTLTQTKVKSPHLLTKTHQDNSRFKPLQEPLFPFHNIFCEFSWELH